MAKKATNKFEEKANELMAWSQLYQYAVNQIDNYRDVQHDDETGDILKDEDGNWVYKDPDVGSYNYGPWVAWKSVAKKLEETKL